MDDFSGLSYLVAAAGNLLLWTTQLNPLAGVSVPYAYGTLSRLPDGSGTSSR